MAHGPGFNATDNPYTRSEFLKICENYRVPNDPMRYRDEKFYWTYQQGVHWPDDYLGPDSMTRWIIEKSDGFTDVGLYKISESVKAYAYLILSSQASARSEIVGNTASALTAQSAFLREDIKRYQALLVMHLVRLITAWGRMFMLPSDMKLKIKTGTVGYNNKNLVSVEKFNLGKNKKVNLMVPVMKSHKVTQTAADSNDVLLPHAITHNNAKIALVLALASGFAIWNIFP